MRTINALGTIMVITEFQRSRTVIARMPLKTIPRHNSNKVINHIADCIEDMLIGGV